MAEPGEQLNPNPDNPKPLGQWTDQEVKKFVDAFSRNDFELIKPNDSGQEGYVKVTIPQTEEGMAKGLIQSEWRMVEAFDTPLEEESQERVKRSIGNTANTTKVSEEEEADWIQTFGKFFQVVGERADQPDPALEEMKMRIREEARKMVAVSFKILLNVANEFSWNSFIQGQGEKYGDQEPPKDVMDMLTAKFDEYKQIGTLIDRDPQAGQNPKFLLVNTVGREIFRSTHELKAS